jgi:putative transposase
VKPSEKRELVQFLRLGFQVSERRACRVIPIDRATQRYRSHRDDQVALRMRLRDLATVRVRYGYRRLHVLLQREGWQVNHKRVFRLYRQEGLSLRLKTRKKRASAVRVPPPAPQVPNEQWSMDFMTDQLASGQRVRILTIVDIMSRVSPAIQVKTSFTGQDVAAVLDQLAAAGHRPTTIFVDNGPEFVSKALDAWAHRNQVKLAFSRLGTPTDNAYIEAFNGRLRDECLNMHWFESRAEAQTTIEAWRVEYNTTRPHSALGNQAPTVFAASQHAVLTAKKSGPP